MSAVTSGLLRHFVIFLVALAVFVAVRGCNRNESSDPPPASKASPVAGLLRSRFLMLMNVGKAYYENGSSAEAVDAFTECTKLIPAEIPARMNLARALLANSQFEQALEQARRVVDLDRYNIAARYVAGLACLGLGETPKAVAWLESAVRDDPSVTAVRFQLAAALMEDGRDERAEEELRIVLAADPEHWSAHFKLAAIARKRRDTEAFDRHTAEFERLRSEAPPEQRNPNYWQQCEYLEVVVPSEVHQPDPNAIKVQFTAGNVDTGAAISSAASVVVANDVNGDFLVDLLTTDEEGRLRLMIGVEDGTFRDAGWRLELGLDPRATLGRPADFDNDGRLDFLLLDQSRYCLIRQDTAGGFVDVTDSSGLGDARGPDAAWVDFDHDGDVDIVQVDQVGRVILWQSDGTGSFENVSLAAGIPPKRTDATRVQPADMNNDQRVDIVVAAREESTWELRNDGLGAFVPLATGGPAATHLLVEDFDNDLSRDVVTASSDRIDVALSSGSQSSIALGTHHVSSIRYLDYDNDGWLDLIVVRKAPDDTARLRLFRNIGAAGWKEVTAATGLEKIRMTTGVRVHMADLDRDGDSDLLFIGTGGTLRWARNDGGNANAQLKIHLTGTRSNRSGLDTLIELNAGTFRLSRTVGDFPIEIGVGKRDKIDSVRAIWPTGIVDHAIWVDPSKPLVLEEPLVSAGSCPYLYAWDGQSFRFITDMLGASPLGLSLARGRFVPADTDEYLWVGNQETFPPRDGNYAIQITDELREVLYLDHVRLIAVDHPSHLEAHPTSKVQPPPFPADEILLLDQLREALRVIDDIGHDWTETVRSIDDRFTAPSQLEKPQFRGRARKYSLELDFGPLDTDAPLVLVLTGWLMWGDAGVNVAVSQQADVANPWPTLEALTDAGWQPVDVTVGMVSGKTKTICVDLADRLPSGTSRLRLTTSFELYWDRIALFQRKPSSPSQITQFNIASARLAWRGYPKQTRRDDRHPIVPDPNVIIPQPPWRGTLTGWCTRYGDIRELLEEVDDRLAILNGGDAAVIEFPDTAPPLPEGWTRDFFLFVDGWDKDGDYNVAHGDRVAPLPFHGMDDQRNGTDERALVPNDWTTRYNTRWVGQ